MIIPEAVKKRNILVISHAEKSANRISELMSGRKLGGRSTIHVYFMSI